MELSFFNIKGQQGTTAKIAYEDIKHVQLHRLGNGHYWLSLLLTGHPLGLLQTLSFNSGVVGENVIKKVLEEGEEQLGLWEVSVLQKDTEGLSFENMVYIQQWLQG